MGDLVERRLVLGDVLAIARGVGAQIAAAPVRGVKGDGVVFMVPHDGAGRAGIHHRLHDLQRLANLRPAIHEIAHEDYRALRVTVSAVGFHVAEFFEQCAEWIGMAVDVADDVVFLVFVFHKLGFSFRVHRQGIPSMIQPMTIAAGVNSGSSSAAGSSTASR